MTVATFTTTTTGGHDLDHYAGRADAYDDHATLTIDELNVRAAYIADLHPSHSYAQGYAAYTKGVDLEQRLTSGRGA